MLVDTAPLWFAQTNTYLIAGGAGEPGLLVDVPPDPEAVLDMVNRHRIAPVALLLTHGHVDHTGGAKAVAADSSATAYIHPYDDFLTLDPTSQLESLFGMVPPGDFSPPPDRVDLEDGQKLTIAGVELEVLHTPGHTPGHCCFLSRSEGILFAGDQLFAGSIGRTDLPGGDFDTLMRSMSEKILTLDDEIIVYPGHGPATTLGRERRTNPFLRGQ